MFALILYSQLCLLLWFALICFIVCTYLALCIINQQKEKSSKKLRWCVYLHAKPFPLPSSCQELKFAVKYLKQFRKNILFFQKIVRSLLKKPLHFIVSFGVFHIFACGPNQNVLICHILIQYSSMISKNKFCCCL